MDIWDCGQSVSTDSSSGDDIVIKKLASMFYWEDGVPDFSIPENRELLKQRLLEYGYTCVGNSRYSMLMYRCNSKGPANGILVVIHLWIVLK